MDLFDYESILSKLEDENQKRRIPSIESKSGSSLQINSKPLLNLSSNDYLGLASNETLQKEFLYLALNTAKPSQFAFGSSASRLMTGSLEHYDDLESQIAKFYEKESALVFNSGYHANLGAISCLIGPGDIIFSDKLNHASIIDGIKLSGAEFHRYKHLDYAHLESLLKKYRARGKRAYIISESIFSMDGDRVQLKALIALKKSYDCYLYIDEAHAIGAMGALGRGLVEVENCLADVDLIVGTFGKAFASVGAFIATSHIIRNFLINKARSFIFSTSLPPISISWTLFILNKIPGLKSEREKLEKTSNLFRNLIKSQGFQTGGDSHIIPIILGDNEKTLAKAKLCQEAGFLLMAIRPPTVPIGSSRLRISLRSDINFDDISLLSEVLKKE